jgi:hypothetical protein
MGSTIVYLLGLATGRGGWHGVLGGVPQQREHRRVDDVHPRGRAEGCHFGVQRVREDPQNAHGRREVVHEGHGDRRTLGGLAPIDVVRVRHAEQRAEVYDCEHVRRTNLERCVAGTRSGEAVRSRDDHIHIRPVKAGDLQEESQSAAHQRRDGTEPIQTRVQQGDHHHPMEAIGRGKDLECCPNVVLYLGRVP